MKPPHQMTGEERMYASAWCLTLIDAIDGPLEGDYPDERKEEAESRIISRGQVETLDESFRFLCDVIDVDAEMTREAFMSGGMSRAALMQLYSAVRKE